MRKLYRKIIFWFFFILFSITTPVAILYSRGYRFDFYKNIFIHSGSVTIKPIPSEVNVYVNGKLQETSGLDIINNSITINGLRPGSYNIRVTAEGYQDWVKNSEVHSGISTEFWNVVLIPKSIEVSEIKSPKTVRFFVSPSGNKIFNVKLEEGNKSELWFYDVKKKQEERLFSDDNVEYRNEEFVNSEWNRKEKLILCPVFRNGEKNFLMLDLDRDISPSFLSDLSGLFDLKLARWSMQKELVMYFLGRDSNSQEDLDNLYSFDLSSKKVSLLKEKVLTYDISSTSIYYLRENGIIYKADLSGNNEEQITFSPFDYDNKKNCCRLIAYDDYRQAMVTASGKLFIHNNGKSDFSGKISENVKSVQFSDDGKKLLFWNNYEISVMFFRDWEVQPRRKENEIQQLVRFSSSVSDVFWYRDYEHVFFANQKKIKLLELDPRDRRLSFDILDYGYDNFTSSYDTFNRTYYFIDKKEQNSSLYYFKLPEQSGIFGD